MIEIDVDEVSKLTAAGGVEVQDNDGQDYVVLQGVTFRVSGRMTEHRRKELEVGNEPASL